MIVLDVEEMIESRRPLLEFLLNMRNKYQFLKMAKKHTRKFLLYVFNTKLIYY